MEKKEKQKMNSDMKIFIVFAVLIALGFAIFFYSMLRPKVIVTVEGKKVNAEEFQYYFSQNLTQALQSKDPSVDEKTFIDSARDSIKQQTLSQVVQIELLLHKAKKDRFKASGKEINEAWQTFKDNLVQNAQSSEMTLEQFSKAAFGVSLNKAEKYYKDYVKSQKYMAAKTEEVTVDKKEVTEFYNENKTSLDRAVIRHILVSCEEDAKEDVVNEKKKFAESILEKVNNGEDFVALALEYSEDPGSKEDGGRYEIQPNGRMVPEFEEWTFSHKAGDTGIIRTSFGFHIMKLDSIFNSYEAQSKEIEFAYKSQKYQSMLQEAMSGNEYKIEVKEGYSGF